MTINDAPQVLFSALELMRITPPLADFQRFYDQFLMAFTADLLTAQNSGPPYFFNHIHNFLSRIKDLFKSDVSDINCFLTILQQYVFSHNFNYPGKYSKTPLLGPLGRILDIWQISHSAFSHELNNVFKNYRVKQFVTSAEITTAKPGLISSSSQTPSVNIAPLFLLMMMAVPTVAVSRAQTPKSGRSSGLPFMWLAQCPGTSLYPSFLSLHDVGYLARHYYLQSNCAPADASVLFFMEQHRKKHMKKNARTIRKLAKKYPIKSLVEGVDRNTTGISPLVLSGSKNEHIEVFLGTLWQGWDDISLHTESEKTMAALTKHSEALQKNISEFQRRGDELHQTLKALTAKLASFHRDLAGIRSQSVLSNIVDGVRTFFKLDTPVVRLKNQLNALTQQSSACTQEKIEVEKQLVSLTENQAKTNSEIARLQEHHENVTTIQRNEVMARTLEDVLKKEPPTVIVTVSTGLGHLCRGEPNPEQDPAAFAHRPHSFFEIYHAVEWLRRKLEELDVQYRRCHTLLYPRITP